MDVHSQTGFEIGVTGGGSYYIGEYNPSGHFKNVQGYAGGFFRFNLNDRYAIRFSGNFSDIKIKGVQWPGNEDFPTSFNTSVADL
ncbi:hypothetical protein LJB94_02995, partial [Odoribacter sp. OttesenSCG-928-G04]|nr:hypothetical protein [Odoribacter sp. OttesenSCG-928-G04]